MIINISHFFLIIGTIKMCLKKVKKTKRVQKGPKMKKKMNFGLHNKMAFVEFTLRRSDLAQKKINSKKFQL